ncbi:MAG: acyl carrier protein [Solirubrobacterales bacterium]|nr:acyl carrier protein [Solirubrobacterales bacterium]
MATATRQEVEQKVIDTLATFGPDREDITPTATLEELDIDSLDMAELGQVVEDEYGVEIRGEDAATVNTVSDAVDLIVSRMT